MRGRSSKQETKEVIELDSKLSKLKDDQPHLSGAYIRSLVKQLSSSRIKDPMNPKDPDCVDSNGICGQNLTKFGDEISETPQTQQPQQHKKQVRRRLHTSRPYQERLLNMAEARREIVTALKFHRAAMKQASEKQQQQEQQQEQQSQSLQLSTPQCFEQEGKLNSRRNPRIYPSNAANFSNYLENFSYSSFSCPPPPSNPFSWTTSQVPTPFPEALNFPLPNQTLGLNLNLHDFNNLDTTLFHNSNIPSNYSYPSPSSSSSPPLSVSTEEHPSAAISQDMGGSPAVTDVLDAFGGSGLHPALDDEEMAEIRSIGEQHQMEWNDKMNLVTSAWWFKFLKTMELGSSEEMKAEDDGFHPFDEVMEVPAWLNANESCLLQQHFNDYCPEYSFQDPALPCMDIGEFEGMDSEWLS